MPRAALLSDRAALDQIAAILSAPEWRCDHLEAIVDTLSQTDRPHPGEYSTTDAYADAFTAVTDRNLPRDD